MKNTLIINDLNKEVKINGKIVLLTKKEYDLLYYLYQNPNQVLSKNQIVEKIWNDECEDASNTIYCQIYQLRKKIEPDLKHPHFILTMRGFGYKFLQESK